MGCESPWTEKDESGVYSDCHVWAPFYTIIGSFVILGDSVCAVVALQRLRHKGRRTLPALILIHSSLMTIVYIVRLSTGLVLSDKNVALNFFHGLSLGFLWVICGVVPLQYLEVVFLTEKLRGKTESWVPQVRIIFCTVITLSFLSANFIMTASSLIDSVNAIRGYWSLTIASATAYVAIVLYYGLRIRRLLYSMEVSKSFYRNMIRKLDFFMIPLSALGFGAILFCTLSLMFNVFYENTYLLLNGLMAGAAGLVGFILYSSKPPPKPDGEHTSNDQGKSGSNPVSAGTNPLSKSSPIGSQKEPGPSSGLGGLTVDGPPDSSPFVLDSSSHPMLSTTIPYQHPPSSPKCHDASPSPTPRLPNSNSNSKPNSGRNTPLIEYDSYHIEMQNLKNKEKSYLTKGVARMEDGDWIDPGLGTSIHRDIGEHLLLGGVGGGGGEGRSTIGNELRALSSSQSYLVPITDQSDTRGPRKETHMEWEKEEWSVQ